MSFHKFIPHIEAARLAGEETLRAAGLELEPAEVTYAVEAHRWFWKPQKTAFLFIADSTVFTSAADLAVPAWLPYHQAITPEFAAPETVPPKEYVGHIYCPGFGEIQMQNHVDASSQGVIQELWRIVEFGFKDIPPQPGIGVLPHDIARLKRRCDVLRHFQAESLWLLDASVHATYRGVGNGLPEGQRRLHDDVAGELHIQWWTRYGKPLINYLREKEDQELSVWIVGETLHKRLMRHNHPLTDFPDTHKRWIGLNQPPENEKTYYKERVMKALQH